MRVTDGSGNTNICWKEILVEDKIRPFCYAPHNTSVDCTDLPYDFSPTNLAQLRIVVRRADIGRQLLLLVEELLRR
jgi:hypothetical protein